MFGAWENKSFNTVYQASSDGFVSATVGGTHSDTDQYIDISGYTDSNNPPTTYRVGCLLKHILNYHSLCLMMPVRKGDY